MSQCVGMSTTCTTQCGEPPLSARITPQGTRTGSLHIPSVFILREHLHVRDHVREIMCFQCAIGGHTMLSKQGNSAGTWPDDFKCWHLLEGVRTM